MTNGDTVKAQRSTVRIGDLEVDGFMLPDGSYRMSQAQAAEAIEEPPVYALRFLRSKESKALLGEGYTDYTPESVDVEPEPGKRGQTRINALPLEVVTAYWLTRSYKGNKKAFALAWGLLTESLDRRFDAAFGVIRSEAERDERLAGRVQRLERDLERLGEAFAIEDDLKRERDRFYQRLVELGEDPYQLPDEEVI